MFKLLSFLLTNQIIFILLNATYGEISFPMVYKWSKRVKDTAEGCIDPTEPFQCPGSNICISLQFLCDGHPGDCPNDYDEDVGLCTASKRPPKDTIRRFLTAQYSNYGGKFIEYVFGSKVLAMFNILPITKAIEILSISLIVSPSIEDFARVMELTELEKKRLIHVLDAINTGQVNDLPSFIVNSASEGLSTLADRLIKTKFIASDM